MTDSRQIEARAADWLARRDADDWTAQEQQALDAWLAASARHKVAFLRLQSAWAEAGRLQALGAGVPAGALPPRSTPMAEAEDMPADARPDLRDITFAPRERSSHRRRWPQGVAAALALLALGSVAWGGWQLSGREQAVYASTVGQIQTVTLPDGSTATLSSDSRLDVRISRGERHVALARGEAFFDVAHDARRPFVVETEGRRVQAVGTRFSVRRDPDAVRVVVTEGKVRLESRAGREGPAQPVSLLPAGSVATAGRNGVLVRSLPVAEAERYLEWRDGFLTFDDTSLAEAAAEFNRFNTRKLELGDDAVADLRVGGNFRWSNAEGFAHLLEQGFPVRAERHADRIVLYSR
ncbi:FecR domain-containing protein [Pseudoxanthomonas sp. LH2527]|uniref:FecR family protein n=1 Tax=Pseudoxanthomonas sp. LH2527 TaxID=2923249 RepID=UPI001F13C8D3|nr:FecR domain-containing protein [Pseudoxanthomonas sp. LH2527]MCH6484856.1 FecR domain-containing protein [Pseudoxanthomonas sp. LH2527]